MTTSTAFAFESFSANSQVFVPSNNMHQHQSTFQKQGSFTPQNQVTYQAPFQSGGFSDYHSRATYHQNGVSKHNQPQIGEQVFSRNSHDQQSTQAYQQPVYMQSYVPQQLQGHYANYRSGYTAPAQQFMPEFKMNFASANNQSQQQKFHQQNSFVNQQLNNGVQFKHHQILNQTRKVQSEKMSFLPLGKLSRQQQIFNDVSSPVTNSTAVSSQESHFSDLGSVDGDMSSEIGGFDSPVCNRQKSQNTCFQQSAASPSSCISRNSNGIKTTETAWKKKVKTELCRFWLNGQECENSQKEQGCGFAHGQEELQKKKGLSRQYLTSVCKNFLESPSKCNYGQRCIFQHPSFDVRERQKYSNMIQDNARYTAMRLFQDIEGSEVIYINTYAATAPRLSVFKGICSSNKDESQDTIDHTEEDDIVPAFSRDQFRNNSGSKRH